MWQQELEFLAEIDTYRYNRHFYLPAILEFLDTTEADLDGQPLPISRQDLGRMYAPMKIAVDSTTNLRRMRGFWKDCRPTFIQTSISDRLFTLLLVHQSELEAIRKMDHVQDEGSAELLQEGDRNGWHRGQGISFSLGKVLELGGLPSFMEHAQSEYLRLFEKARSIRDTLSQAENASLLDGLL